MAEAMFAKAGRGYDRAQVDAFLLELNRSFAEKEAALQDQIKQLSDSLAEVKKSLECCEQQKAETIESYTAQLQEKEKECAAMHASIGQRMMAADSRAEDILSEAQKQADDLLREARARAACEAERIVTETKQRCEVIGAAAAEFSFRMNAIASEMQNIETLTEAALDAFKQKTIGETR